MCRSPDYIKRAGGYGNRAKKKGVYAIYMNGAVEKISKRSSKDIQPGTSRFGYCKKGDAKGASGFEYSIAINKYIVNDKDISDTVAHELLHTIKTAKNHLQTGVKTSRQRTLT